MRFRGELSGSGSWPTGPGAGRRVPRARELCLVVGNRRGAGAAPVVFCGYPGGGGPVVRELKVWEHLGSDPGWCWVRLVLSRGGTVTPANACNLLPGRGTRARGARTRGLGRLLGLRTECVWLLLGSAVYPWEVFLCSLPG